MAMACVRLVLLVTMHLALCSLLASAGPRCSASWPVWSRRTVAVAFTWLVVLVTIHLALCSLPWFAGPFLDPVVQTVQNPVEFTQVQFLDEDVFMPVVGQRLALTVQTVPKPVEFPQVQFWHGVVFMPVAHGTDSAETRGVPTGAVVSPVVAQRQIPMVSLTMEIKQLQLIDKVFDGRLCMFLGCRLGEDSRAPQFLRGEDGRDPTVQFFAPGQGFLTCPLICVYRSLTWSRQCRVRGVRRCSSWTRLPCPWCARQRSRQCRILRGVRTGAVLGQGKLARNDRFWDGPDSAENCGVSRSWR